jgi:hypothetical protein
MYINKSVVVLALGLGFAAGASADDVTVNYGTIAVPSTLSQVIQHVSGSFSDKLSFSFAQPAYGGGWVNDMAFTIPGFGSYNIDGLEVKLYTASDVLVNTLSGPVDSKSGSGTFAPGSYYFTVSGIANGTLGGEYVFSAQALPVPEPESYAMLLAGLGLIGAMVRRRTQG